MNLNVSEQDWFNLGAMVVAGIVYGIRLWQNKKSDRGSQDTSSRLDQTKLDYIGDLRADNAKLRLDIDKLAGERNDALAEVGALRAELAVYKGQCQTKSMILHHCPVIQKGG